MLHRVFALSIGCAGLLAAAPALAINIVTAAGNGTNASNGDNGLATAAALMQPVDIGVDGSGNLYILDGGAKVIRKVGQDNNIRTVATLPAAGKALAVARDGTLYVSMPTELRKIAPNGAVKSYPETVTGLAVDASGNLYMADPNHYAVHRMDTNGAITTIASHGSYPCFDGNTSIDSACILMPSDVSIATDGTVFIADPVAQQIWKVTTNWAIYGMLSTGNLVPTHVAVGWNGSVLFTSDSDGGAQVHQILKNGTLDYAVGNGTAGFSGDGGPPGEAQLNGASGLYLDPAWNFYIADTQNHRVRRLRRAWVSGPAYDLNLDYQPDLIWRNRKSGQNVAWNAGDSTSRLPMTAVTNLDWEIAGGGNFDNADGPDIVWRNRRTGANAIWRSGNAATQLPIPAVTDVAWTVAGIGEFDGAAMDDILWRNLQTGANVIWRAGNANSRLAVATVGPEWVVAGVGDFGGDGQSDILWRNPSTGSNVIWRSGNAAARQVLPAATAVWNVDAIGDFDGDGRSDILWRNVFTGVSVIWRTGDARMSVISTMGIGWSAATVADFDLDGAQEVLWRNLSTGADFVWHYDRGSWVDVGFPSVGTEWVPAR